MQTTNFDNNIKKRLEERTLEPSTKSWEQLRSKLDKKDKANTPMYWWLTIAASFLGGILLMTVFFNSEETASDSIVTQDTINGSPENTFNPLVNANPNDKVTVEETISPPIVETQGKKTTQQPNTNLSIAQQKTAEQLEEASEEKTPSFAQQESQEEKVINEIIANLNPEVGVSDEEIDALLNEAFAKISKENFQSNPVITSSDLLEDVEVQIEESFRERIFEILKEGIQISREAVANRNQ